MKVVPYNMGACGMHQVLHAGVVNFNDADIASGIELCKLPANVIVTKAVCVVETAFNAATTNVLTVGTNASIDNILGANDVTEGTAGAYQKDAWVELDAATSVKVKYTQSGAAATAGKAQVYLFVVRVPEE
jgi:hypothetical protein